MRVLCVVALGAVLSACGGDGATDPPPSPPPSSVLIEPAVRSIVIGDTAMLSARVVTAGGDTMSGAAAKWSSSDTSVATVDASGTVHGKRVGSVRIVAAIGADTSSAGVTVRKPAATLEVSRLVDTMMIGRQFRLFVTAPDEVGNMVADAPLRWTSSDTTIFDVDETGWIRARSWGSATITIETESATFTKMVSVGIRQYGPTLRWTAVDAGDGNACALTTDGEPMCWGSNIGYKLGYGVIFTFTASPQPVLGQHRFTSISTGFQHSCGIDADSTAWCWGANGDGQLGSGAPGTATPEPQRVASENRWKFIVAAGHGGTCAIAADDVPYCWGHNDFYQLGRPPQSVAPEILPWGDGPATRLISKDHFVSCLVLVNGEGWCSGQRNGSGSWQHAPAQIAGGYRFRSIATGQYHSCGVTHAGVTYCWGSTWGTGSLGTGSLDEDHQSEPVPVQGGPEFTVLTAGVYHTCGLTAEGVAYCWGGNASGQLGSFHANASAVPIRVSTPHVWRSISAGGYGTCGITPDDEMFCWGQGFHQ